jgi:hypothetical protein
MTIGDGHSGLGKTRHHWDPDVHRVVQRVFNRFSSVSCNTYDCHPFCGPPGDRGAWQRRSIDIWGPAGRGDPLDPHLSELALDFLIELPGKPLIRHWILDHTLWVRGVGYLPWPANDHTGLLRHVHVTYLPVPPLST